MALRHDRSVAESPRLAEKLTDLEQQLAYSESKRVELESELQSRRVLVSELESKVARAEQQSAASLRAQPK